MSVASVRNFNQILKLSFRNVPARDCLEAVYTGIPCTSSRGPNGSVMKQSHLTFGCATALRFPNRALWIGKGYTCKERSGQKNTGKRKHMNKLKPENKQTNKQTNKREQRNE